ncbi:MAG: hypothetical protein EOP88_10585 [Verrucomicrobiaceae bacterium]|nr:MAG: hypothetical protein EOP88_10585 [Verrucomicrobiaceae bacterium]
MHHCLIFTAILGLAGTLTSCQPISPDPGPPGKTGSAPSASSARKLEKSLAGGWHCNTDGATKRFLPGPKPGKGTTYGFNPTGGTYQITSANSSTRTLGLHLSIEKNEDHEAQETDATVVFDTDGKHMTFTRAGDQSYLYYRTR